MQQTLIAFKMSGLFHNKMQLIKFKQKCKQDMAFDIRIDWLPKSVNC